MAAPQQNDPQFTQGGNVFGRLASQWNKYFGSKVDAEAGTADNLTLTGTLNLLGATVIGFLTNTFKTLFVNSNLATLPLPLTGTVIQAANADSVATRFEGDSFGAAVLFTGRRADGSNAAPLVVTSGDELVSFNAWGCTGSLGGSGTWGGPSAAVSFFAGGTGAWTVSSTPTEIRLRTVPNGSVTLLDRWHVAPDGGLYSHGVSGGSHGAGSVNAASISVNGSLITAVTGGSAPITVAGGLVGLSLNSSQFQVNGSNALALVTSAGGFVNRIRNASLTQWYSGGSGVTGTVGGWTAEGVYVIPGGASVSWAEVYGNVGSSSGEVLSITGATSVTGVIVRFPVGSYDAAPLTGQTVTCQLSIFNATGGTITPKITVKHAATQDSWGAPVTDVNAVSLTAVPNNTGATVAYTFAASSLSYNGLSISFDLGNNFSTNGKIVYLSQPDLRATPGVPLGINNAPPAPEVRGAADDTIWNQRFFETSYDNHVAPGTATTLGEEVEQYWAIASALYVFRTRFKASKRADPTVVIYSPVTGAPANINNGTAGDTTVSAVAIGAAGFVVSGTFAPNGGFVGSSASWHWTADCRIAGA